MAGKNFSLLLSTILPDLKLHSEPPLKSQYSCNENYDYFLSSAKILFTSHFFRCQEIQGQKDPVIRTQIYFI